MLKTLGLAAALLAGSLIPSRADSDRPKPFQPSITLLEWAFRDVVPDTAIVRLAVQAEKPTASAVTEEVARLSKSVIDEAKAQGFQPADIETKPSLSIAYDDQYDTQGRVIKRTPRGYQARNDIKLRLNDTSRAGAVARSLIEKGANVFDGIDFSIRDDRPLLDELRVEATKSAMHKAKLYTETLGVGLGRVLSIDPNPDQGQADLPRRSAPRDQVVQTIIPVEPGVQRVSASVSVTWEIAP